MVTQFTTSANYNEIISLAELKNHCRIDVSDDDDLLTAFRASAIQFVQEITGRVMGDVSAVVYLDHWHNVTLQIAPITAINSIQYIDAGGNVQTLTTAFYYTDIAGSHARIKFHDVPDLYDYAMNRVIINVDVGHPESDIPAPMVHAVRLLVALMYEQRAAAEIRSVNEIPFGVHALLSPFRIFA